MKNSTATINIKTPATASTVTKTPPAAKRGRPAHTIKLPMNKSFTINDLLAAHPNEKRLTLHNHVKRALESGTLTKLDRVVETGKRGKPAFIFINAKIHQANMRNLAKAKAAAAASPLGGQPVETASVVA